MIVSGSTWAYFESPGGWRKSYSERGILTGFMSSFSVAGLVTRILRNVGFVSDLGRSMPGTMYVGREATELLSTDVGYFEMSRDILCIFGSARLTGWSGSYGLPTRKHIHHNFPCIRKMHFVLFLPRVADRFSPSRCMSSTFLACLLPTCMKGVHSA